MEVTLKFLRELPLYQHEQPYTLHGFPDIPAEQQTNCEYEEVPDIEAHDLRGSADMPVLEEQGFEYLVAPSRCNLSSDTFEQDLPSDHYFDPVSAYLEETMDIVRKRLNANLVVTIDWRFRRNDNAALPFREEYGDIRKQAVAIAAVAHCDFSVKSGSDRMGMHLSEEELLPLRNGKVHPRIVNVWRPLGTVTNAPLVFADRRTVAKGDIVEVEQVHTDKVNSTAFVYNRPEHAWYWLSHQKPEEIAMFTTWAPESSSSFADAAPHAAAYMYREDVNDKPRESVEVRIIVFTNIDTAPE